MKTCPHCMEEIPDKARKCKFCWEWVTEEEDIFDKKEEIDDIDDEDLDDDIDDEDLDDDIDDEDLDDDIDDEISHRKKENKSKNSVRWMNLSDHEINKPKNQVSVTKNDKESNSNKQLIMAIVWGILLIIALIKLSYILRWIILLVAWIFLIMPYYIDRFGKR